MKLGVGRLAFLRRRAQRARAEAVALGLIAGAWEYKELKTPPPEDGARAPLDDSDDPRRDDDASTWRSAPDGRSARVTRWRARSAMMPGNLCTPDSSRDTARDIAAASRHEGHGARTRRDGARRMGIVPLRRAGHAAGSEAHRARVSRRRSRREARRARRQGALLRLRRHLDQAGAGHGVDEVRHVRRGRRARRDGGDRHEWSFRSTSSVSIGATTNMPSGTAVKPGDVVQSHVGQVHRDHQHRRRRTARARRRALVRRALRARRRRSMRRRSPARASSRSATRRPA